MVRSVQKYLALAGAVIHLHLKTTGGRNEKLIAFFVRMGSSGLAARNIIQIENPSHLKRQMNIVLNGRNVSRPELNTGK